MMSETLRRLFTVTEESIAENACNTDGLEMRTSPEARDEEVIHLTPVGVRLFRHALGRDLHDVEFTLVEVRKLSEEVFASPSAINARPDERWSDVDQSERLTLIATVGYREAARQLSLAERTLHVWASVWVPKPFKRSRPRRNGKPASNEPMTIETVVPISSASPEQLTDITINPRPVGSRALAADIFFIETSSTNSDQYTSGWQNRALCAQTDPSAFHPERGVSTKEAKKVCRSCEVREECLDYALTNNERFGVWGGLSERERRKLKRRAA